MSDKDFAAALCMAQSKLDGIQAYIDGKFGGANTVNINLQSGKLQGVNLAICIAKIRSRSSHGLTAQQTVDHIKDLISLSRSEPAAFRELSTAAQICLDRRIRLPHCLRKWVCDFLAAKVVPPKTPTNRRKAKAYPHLYDMFIREAVASISTELSVPVISENSTNWSACDVVASALLQLGLKPNSSHGVYKVYQRMGGKFAHEKVSRETFPSVEEIVVKDPFDQLPD